MNGLAFSSSVPKHTDRYNTCDFAHNACEIAHIMCEIARINFFHIVFMLTITRRTRPLFFYNIINNYAQHALDMGYQLLFDSNKLMFWEKYFADSKISINTYKKTPNIGINTY